MKKILVVGALLCTLLMLSIVIHEIRTHDAAAKETAPQP